MPRYSFDEEVFEEYAEYMEEPMDTSQYVRSEDGQLWSYEAAETQLDADKISKGSLQAFLILQEMGVTEIFVRYDGGYDEGFAYFDSATLRDESWPVEALAAELAPGPLGERPSERTFHYSDEVEAGMTRVQEAKDALDGLACDLAGQLLGNGFGTGEAAIDGRFRLEMGTGHIVDLPMEIPGPPSSSEE